MNNKEFDLYMPEVDKILTEALHEDVGSGDITTRSTVAPEKRAHGRYIAKESGVLCGLFICERVARRRRCEIHSFVLRRGFCK